MFPVFIDAAAAPPFENTQMPNPPPEKQVIATQEISMNPLYKN